MEVGH